MPLFETICQSESCSLFNEPIEHYYKNSDATPQACDSCGGETKFLISCFNAPWTGDLERFNEPGRPTHNWIPGGHYAYRVKSSRLVGGAPECVKIRTRQDQMEYCRDEGLEDPFYNNPHEEIVDGKASKSRPRGAWV